MAGTETDVRANAVGTVRSILETASARDVTFLAAGFAYFAFVSLIPLVLLALVVGSLVGGEALAERLILVAGDLLPAAGEELVTDVLTTEAGRSEAAIVALVVGAWGGLKVFRGLRTAFDDIYDVTDESSLLEAVRDGLVVIGAIAGALSLMVVIGTILGFAPEGIPLSGAFGWIALLFGLVLVFLPIYSVLPAVHVEIREALPGSVFAAVGWTILQFGFQLYAANAGRYAAYGAVGAILLFVTWLYFAGIVILLGAVINVVLSRPQRAV